MGRYKVQKIYKHKTSDPTLLNDPTYENYIALLTAILIDEDDKDYKHLVYNRELFDKEEEEKRCKEIDEIRARGEKTELQIWYENSFKRSEGKRKEERVKRLFSKIARMRHERLKKEKEEILKKYSNELVDISKMDKNEIIKYKVKVINVVTGEIKIYDSRELCSFETKIERRCITTYMKTRRIYKNIYLYTIINEKVSEKELKKIKYKSIRIKATNLETGEEIIFKKLKDTSDFFEMNYTTFQQKFRYRGMREIKGWKLEELDITI